MHDALGRGTATRGPVRHWGWETGGCLEMKISTVHVVGDDWVVGHIRPRHRRVVVDYGANRFAGNCVAPHTKATPPVSEEET